MPQPPNLNKMLEQAQQMLAQQQEAQEKLKEQRVEATAGGGMVKVVMTGDLHLESITIEPDAVDPEDVEMLQDMVVAAVNEAVRSAQELQESKLGGASAGFDPMSALDALGDLWPAVVESLRGEKPMLAAALDVAAPAALADDAAHPPRAETAALSEDELIDTFMREFDAEELPAEQES